MTFFIMGLPALLVAALVKLTIAEPRRKGLSSHDAARPLPRMTAILSSLWRQRSSRHLIAAIILFFTLGSGLAPWYAAFMMRSHGMGTSELGVWLGLIFGLGGIAGTLLGGYGTARWFPDDERGQMRLSAAAMVALVPCFILFLLLPGRLGALIALAPLIVAGNFIFAPAFALLQRLVLDEMRATTLAVVMFLANLIGMGLGPQIVGVLSDWLTPTLGTDSLRYAMLLVSLVSLGPAYHLWQVANFVQDDLSLVKRLASDHSVATGFGPRTPRIVASK
jgi:predicted MFS family arabinose efflux permease